MRVLMRNKWAYRPDLCVKKYKNGLFRPINPQKTTSNLEAKIMKVRPSVKPICEKCKVIKRNGKVMVICQNPRHKQKQG